MTDLLEKFSKIHGVAKNASVSQEDMPTDAENTINNSAIKMFSKKLNANLWLVKDEQMQKSLIADGVTDVVFTHKDMHLLHGAIFHKMLRGIYNVKHTFQGARICL